MDTTTVATLLGFVLPFIIGIVRRYIYLTTKQAYSLVFIVCLIVSLALELVKRDWDFRLLIINFSSVLAVSQLVYGAVIKGLDIDGKLEGTK